jgi:hypothetical protein
VETGSQGGGFFDDDEEWIAAIEREIGPEAAEVTRRSLELAREPRALTDAERAELRASLEPVLRDMRASGAIVPDVREEAHDDLGPDYVYAWIRHPESVGSQSIHVQVSLPPAERIADLADQVQEWEVEELAAAGRPATWPECPEHPDSHPLAPQARGDQAAWTCPVSGHVISVIGALPAVLGVPACRTPSGRTCLLAARRPVGRPTSRLGDLLVRMTPADQRQDIRGVRMRRPRHDIE